MKKRILIVDDEFGLVDILAEMLADLGYEVSIAIDGRRALESLAEQTADLILLDWMMPVMDGAATLQAIRDDPRLAATPVVLMSALPQAIPRSARALAQDVLAKPFTPQTLASVVARLLRSTP